MFKHRLITAVFIFCIVVGTLFYGSVWMRALLTAVLIGACVYEWNKLIPLSAIPLQLLFSTVAVILSLLTACYAEDIPLQLWVLAVLIIWIPIILCILFYPRSESFWGQPVWVATWGLWALAFFCGAMVAIMRDYSQGPSFLMFAIALVWTADVGAYLFGKGFGKHKLIPRVSPGKSWEGAAGAFLMILLATYIGARLFEPNNTVFWWLGCICLFPVSVFGDLFISMLKRRVGLKDTGAVLPGHGGMLDRLDSLIAVLPFALILYRTSFPGG